MPALASGWTERRQVGQQRYPVHRWWTDRPNNRKGSYYLGAAHRNRIDAARRRGGTL